MIARVKKTTGTLFKESFVPVMLIVAALTYLLIYVNYKASSEADRVLTIEILDSSNPKEDEDDDDTDEMELSFDRNKNAQPLLKEAVDAIDRKDWDKAQAIYQKMLEEQPSSQAYNDLGVLYYWRKDYKQALGYLQQAIATEPVFIDAFVNLGLTYTRLGQYDEALDVYQKTLDKIPHHFLAQLNKGVILMRLKNSEAAILELHKAVELAGGSRKAKAEYNLGLAYRAAGNKNKARVSFLEAIRHSPSYIKPRFALASLEPDTTEGRENAFAIYQKVLDLRPSYPPAYFHIAQLHNSAGDHAASQKYYQLAIQYDPSYNKARYNLALTFLEQARWSDARALFDYLLADAPKDPVLHFQLGRAAYGEKDYATALFEYDHAIELKQGNYPKALLNKGRVLVAMKQIDKAIGVYQQAIALNNDYAQAWYNLGLAYLRNKDFAKSADALSKAVEIKPDYATAWFNLGVVTTQQADIKKAITAYEKAISIRPLYLRAKLNLAILKSKVGKNSEAIRLYKEVLELDPQYAIAWLNLGFTYSKEKEYEQAEAALLNALALERNNIKAKRQLAHNYQQQQRLVEAVTLLQDAADEDERNYELRLELGKALNMAGMVEKARIELEKARILAPGKTGVDETLVSIPD